jgi:hypothetical protein
LEDLGRWPEAAKDCTIAIQVADPSMSGGADAQQAIMSRAYLERAGCYDHMGKKDLAAADRRAHNKMSSELEEDFIGKGK